MQDLLRYLILQAEAATCNLVSGTNNSKSFVKMLSCSPSGELNESLESNTALETHTGVTWRATPPEDGEMSAVLPARSVGRN